MDEASGADSEELYIGAPKKKLTLVDRLEVTRTHHQKQIAMYQAKLVVVEVAIAHLQTHPEAAVEWALFDSAL